MKAPSRVGTKTEEKAWRPWIRINARYSFEIGANITPFIGIETAYALSKPKVDPSSHYRDYTINTGDFFLGIPSGPANSTESFTKGHFPAWEAGLTAGIRFGRRPLSTAKLAQEIELTADVQIDAEIDEEETEQNVDEGVEFEPEEEEAPIAIESLSPADRIKYEGFKSLLIHFDDNSMELTNETKTIIDNWVKEIWNGAYYSKVFDLGRLRIIANCDAQNETTPQQLSEGRARALAVYLWDKFRINISKVFGYGINKPIAENSTAEASAKNRYAQLLLDENDSRNADYKNIIKAEDGTFYIK
jgi:outer membrane protein OmpA-like peptidoglycan-associated protein